MQAAVVLLMLLMSFSAEGGTEDMMDKKATKKRKTVEHPSKRLLKRRELREKSSRRQSEAESFTLDMECVDMQSADCLNYMQNYLYDYIYVDRKYSKNNIPVREPYNRLSPPVEGDVYDTIMAEMLVTFLDLLEVDTKSGVITLSLFIDMYWVDQLLSWNTSKTMGHAELVIPQDMIWIPDFVMYNAVGGYTAKMEQVAVFIYPDGSINYSGKVVVSSACTFDLSSFPFDTQVCSPEFASWAYPNYQLDFSDLAIDIDPNFNNLGWNIDKISSYTTVLTYWDVYDYTFGIYDIKISRFSEYYVRTAILPTLFITGIVLCGLWVQNIAARLSLSVTGFLTNTAVQWTVAQDLPITEGKVWLSSFLMITMIFIAIVCLQCFISGYMNSRKEGKEVPLWMKWMIRCSLLRIPVFNEDPYGSEKETKRSDGSSLPMQVFSPMSRETDRERKSESDGNDGQPDHEVEFSWQRGSRSFDRISRLIIPVAFAIAVGMDFQSSEA